MKKYSRIKEISYADIKNDIKNTGYLALLENGCLMAILTNKKETGLKIGDLMCYFNDNKNDGIVIIED